MNVPDRPKKHVCDTKSFHNCPADPPPLVVRLVTEYDWEGPECEGDSDPLDSSTSSPDEKTPPTSAFLLEPVKSSLIEVRAVDVTFDFGAGAAERLPPLPRFA